MKEKKLEACKKEVDMHPEEPRPASVKIVKIKVPEGYVEDARAKEIMEERLEEYKKAGVKIEKEA